MGIESKRSNPTLLSKYIDNSFYLLFLLQSNNALEIRRIDVVRMSDAKLLTPYYITTMMLLQIGVSTTSFILKNSCLSN